jgi:thioredoxin reductase (NADPH)
MENVVVIGSGPAGLSAAIYLARAGLSPLVFAGSPPGGQLTLTSEVENFPGYDSILGPELIEKMRKQAQRFGAKIVDENVFKVDFSKRPFEILVSESTKIFSQDQLASPPKSAGSVAPRSSSQNEDSLRRSLAQTTDFRKNFVLSLSVIIATGAKALWLNVPGEQELRGKGVSACATCDGFFFKDKVVAVVGGGDTAMEEALTLTKFAKKVYIIHRRDSFRASKIMQERVFANKKIEVIWKAQVVEVMGKNHLEGIKIKSTHGENLPQFKILAVDGLFVAIGHKPDTEIFAGQVELDERGYVITSFRLSLELAKMKFKMKKSPSESEGKMTIQNEKLEKIVDKFDLDYQMTTSVPGVFAAGDCVDYVYRQAATASGMGVSAALEVERWLESSIK